MSSALTKRSKPSVKVTVPKPKRPKVNPSGEIVKLEKRTKTAEEKLMKMQRKIDGFGSKSNLGYDRFANVGHIPGLEDYFIYKGIEGLMLSGDPGIPAPYDPESRAASCVTLQADIDEIPVPHPSSNYYRGYIVMSNQGPNACYYSTNAECFITSDEMTTATHIQFFQVGKIFGMMHSAFNSQDLYALSDYYYQLEGHAWKIYNQEATNFRFFGNGDIITVNQYDTNFDLVDSQTTDPQNNPIMSFAVHAATDYYFTIEALTANHAGKVSLWTYGGGNIAYVNPFSGNVLSPLKWINYNSIRARSSQIRCNINTAVRTNAQNKFDVNGTVTCGVFDAAGPVEGAWNEVIWTQKKHYKFLNQFGSSFAITNSYVRPWYNINFEISNPIMWPESLYFMTYMSFHLPNDTTSVIPFQIKHQGWFDYTTTDSSISRQLVNHKGSEWVVASAAFQRLLPITDNPNHVDVHKKIMQLVRWMSSSKPGPTAIRTAVKGLGKVAVQVLPLIGAAL